MANFAKLHQLSAHSGALYALAPGRQDMTLLSAGSDKVVAEWNLNTGATNNFAIRTDHSIYSLLNIDRKTLVVGTSNGSMHVIDIAEKKEMRHLKLHDQGIFHLIKTADHVIALSGDGALSVWNPIDWSLQVHLRLSSKKLRRCALSDDGSLLAVTCGDGDISIVEMLSWRETHRIHAHKESSNSIIFMPDGMLLTGGKDAFLRLWDSASMFSLIKEIPAHNYAIYDLAISPDRQYVASASRDKTVKIWNTENLELIVRLDRAKHEGHLNSVNAALWLKDENLIATCSDDRSVIIWKMV